MGQIGGDARRPRRRRVGAPRQRRRSSSSGTRSARLGQTSLATLAVSVGVLVVLIVCSRWLKAVPGGLVAVVGAIALSAGFNLQAHGVSTLGHVPSGLPHFGLPSGVSWTEAASLVTTSISIVLVILAQSAATSRAYAVKYRGAARRERRSRRPRLREPRRRSEQHVRRQREPDEDRDGRRGQEPHPGRAADDGGHGRDRPAVPHQAAPVPAERGALRGRLPDRAEADRHREHEGHLESAPRRVLDRVDHRGRRRQRRRRAGHHRRDRPVDRRARPPPLRPA